jgi:penicillin-binding protein A
MKKSMQRTAIFFLSLFIALGLYLTYIQVFQSNQLSAHALNRRNWEMAKTIPRGNILDRKGNVLAKSIPVGKGQNIQYRREYPYNSVFAPVTGFVSNTYGKAGAENAYNQYLSGIDNPQYRLGPISGLWNKRSGYTVILTVDAGLQQTAYRALGNYRGAVIALDPRTGKILAMVSKPTYSPSNVDEDWKKISQDSTSPLLNRALQGLYPPGSSIKPLVAAAALEERTTDTKKIYKSPGFLKIGNYTLHEVNSKALGDVNLEKAIALSSNVAFGQMGLDLGRDRLGRYFEKFGYVEAPPMDIPVEKSRMPRFNKLADGELAQTAIGQGEMLVTPLSMALMTAAFANHGTVMKPMLIASVTDEKGQVMRNFTPEVWIKPISVRTADTVRNMMGEVVEWGTGTAAGVAGIRVAGKTGTAENPHGPPHAWFIGLAPMENPEIVVVVVVENGGSGGSIAAPIARSVFREAL